MIPTTFTGNARDAETGLDYFGARYFSGAQGRFTSPDEPFNDQHPEDPQSWNLYAYGRNNPLAYVDPTGQYVCGSNISKDECATFQKSLDQAQTGANALKEKYGADSKQYTTSQRAIDAYGKAGVDNGVTVDVGNTGKYGANVTVAGAAGAKTADNPTGQKMLVVRRPGPLGRPPPGRLDAVLRPSVLLFCLAYSLFGTALLPHHLPHHLASRLSRVTPSAKCRSDLTGRITTDFIVKHFGLRVGRAAIGAGAYAVAATDILAAAFSTGFVLSAVLIAVADSASMFTLAARLGRRTRVHINAAITKSGRLQLPKRWTSRARMLLLAVR